MKPLLMTMNKAPAPAYRAARTRLAGSSRQGSQPGRGAPLLLGLLCVISACASQQPKVPAAPTPVQASAQTARYSDEDAAQELDFGNAPSQRVQARRRSVQHKSMPLHGAQTQPCAFENCDISDEDDPL